MTARTIQMRLRDILFIALIASCGERDVESCIEDLSSPDSRVRSRASYELVRIGPAAVDALLALAATGSDSLRYISVQILGRIGDPRALPAIRRLVDDRNSHVRRRAILALGEMRDSGTTTELIAVLLDDERSELRAAAAESLGNLGHDGAVPSLIQALQDSAVAVRKQGVVALHQLGTPAAQAAVVQALRDPDETVRFVAAQAVGQRRVFAARDLLRAALGDTSIWVRAEAARSLGLLGDAGVVDELVLLRERGDGPDNAAAGEAVRMLTDATPNPEGSPGPVPGTRDGNPGSQPD